MLCDYHKGELKKDTSAQILPGSKTDNHRPPQICNLDVIISVGYRVKSKRSIAFRKWVMNVLKESILKEYSIS